MMRRKPVQFDFNLEQEHEPMRLAFIAMFADQAGQMQIRRLEAQGEFLVRLATGAGIRRFAAGGA